MLPGHLPAAGNVALSLRPATPVTRSVHSHEWPDCSVESLREGLPVLPTVLITSAIAPPAAMPALKMADSGMRMITTKAGIFFWVGQGLRIL